MKSIWENKIILLFRKINLFHLSQPEACCY